MVWATIANSPGLWPKGVLDNQHFFWLIGYDPPSPLAENLAQEDGFLAVGPNAPRASGSSFFPILETSWGLPRRHACLSSIFVRKNSKIDDFSLPNAFQNPSQNELKSMTRRHRKLYRVKYYFLLIVVKPDP